MRQSRNTNRVMETETISKSGASPKSQMSRGNFRLVLLMSFSITGISLFGQVAEQKEVLREIISKVSSIAEFDAKGLDLIFSFVNELINNYQDVLINTKQSLAFFKVRLTVKLLIS